MALIKTKTGLPNTCSDCGKDAGELWFAENEDEARSGGGVCASCAKKGGKSKSEPSPEPVKVADESEDEEQEEDGDESEDEGSEE